MEGGIHEVMTFDEAYKQLEDEFRERVEEDNRQLKDECTGKEDNRCPWSIFLPNMPPTAPVDYVLVAMEPSLGGWAKTKEEAQEKIDEGFRNFCGVRILHFAVREYLCPDGATYYCTDLAKGAMLTSDPSAGDEGKYQDWYPLLEKELGLVAKPDAKIVSIGAKVGGFISKMGLYGHVGTIMHYSPQASGHFGTEIKGREADFRKFGEGLNCIPSGPCMPNRKCWPDCDHGEVKLSQSQKKLLFDYKVRFGRIREQERSGWRHWQREWQHNLTA